jgi:hypothetical protein
MMMEEKNTMRQVAQHAKIVGWLHIAMSVLGILIGVFVFVILTTVGVIADDPEAMSILTIVAFFTAGLMLIFALPGFIAGYGVLKQKSWGRILAIVLGVFHLVNVPLGTVLGIYTLWALMQEGAIDYFNGGEAAY